MRAPWFHLAQVNIAHAVAPLDSETMAEFVSQLATVNAMAESSPGFVWRLEGPGPEDDPLLLFNLSVWESVENLREFTYKTGHAGPLRDRAKWFHRPTTAAFALWWIPAGHLPDVDEARERLEFRREHGDTSMAFSFGASVAPPDPPAIDLVPLKIDLEGKLFAAAANTPNGDVNRETLFRYRQSGDQVWATYSGGGVRMGALVGAGSGEAGLDVRYEHVDATGVIRTGACATNVEVLPDGRLRLVEEWQWTNGDLSRGRSVMEEVITKSC